jgi:hypothetical protein
MRGHVGVGRTVPVPAGRRDCNEKGRTVNARRRTDDDAEDNGVLRRPAREAWKLLVFIGVILGAVVWVVAIDKAQARTVATEVAEARVAPLEKRFNEHETRDASSKELTDYRSKQIADSLDQIREQIKALCRASARPAVCLGEK